MRLLFISNLYPTAEAPNRGRPNARLLRHFASPHEIGLLVARPKLLPPYADGVDRQAGHALPEDARFSPRIANVPYLPHIGSLANHRLYACWARRAFAAALAEGRPDAVLVAWLYPDACGVAQLAGRHGIPVFGIAQGSDVHAYLHMKWRRKTILEGCNAATGIIARSQDLTRQLADAGVPAAKLRTIYNGVETGVFQPGPQDQARQALSLDRQARLLLYVGNLLPVKNPLLLLDVLAKLPSDTHAVYVGRGPLEGELRSRAAALGLTDRIRLAGLQPPETVATYMQAADLLVVPSRNEGIPNVIREAFACGRPVVATAVGGVGEVIDRDWLGSLTPSGNSNAMADAVASWLARTPEADRIRAHAETFSWDRAVADYLAFIRERTSPS